VESVIEANIAGLFTDFCRREDESVFVFTLAK